MVSKLSQHGTAGFVLANGSMSANTSSEGKIRQQILENDLVDCMIALPGRGAGGGEGVSMKTRQAIANPPHSKT